MHVLVNPFIIIHPVVSVRQTCPRNGSPANCGSHYVDGGYTRMGGGVLEMDGGVFHISVWGAP